MNVKKFLGLALAACLLATPFVDANAQKKGTRKAGARKTATAKKAAPAATPISMDGKLLEGPAKVPGSPFDAWMSCNFADGGMTINLPGAGNIPMSNLKATKAGKTINVSADFKGVIKMALKSTDDGATYEGNIDLNGTKLTMWMLDLPANPVKTTLSNEELNGIVASPDGYTCFIKASDGSQAIAIPAEEYLDGANHSYKLIFDDSAMNNAWDFIKTGTYSIDNGTFTMNLSNGETATGSIYEDGNYINVDLGRHSGMQLNFLMIR